MLGDIKVQLHANAPLLLLSTLSVCIPGSLQPCQWSDKPGTGSRSGFKSFLSIAAYTNSKVNLRYCMCMYMYSVHTHTSVLTLSHPTRTNSCVSVCTWWDPWMIEVVMCYMYIVSALSMATSIPLCCQQLSPCAARYLRLLRCSTCEMLPYCIQVIIGTLKVQYAFAVAGLCS